MTPVAVTGAAAVSAFGLEWRGLGVAALEGTLGFAPSRELASSHPEVLASEVPPIAPADDAGDVRQRKLMTRAARLAAIAMRRALADAGWERGRERIGCFLGVGASGVHMGELPPLLAASLDESGLSLARFGHAGLQACNPLFAFQTMNNFTLCHGAILEGVAGPSAAFASRGGGTVLALSEAIQAILDGDCARALCGGADSALHPVTWSELARAGAPTSGMVPGEGAALLAVAAPAAATAEKPLGHVLACTRASARRRPFASALAALERALPDEPPDLIVIAPWGDPARAPLLRFACTTSPAATVLDVSRVLGEALAATPALAWVAALDLLRAGRFRRALVLSAGLDDEIGLVFLA